MLSRCMGAATLTALLAAPAAVHAQAAKPTRMRVPCGGCIASLPAGTDPRPLLVLLHGDGEGAETMFEAWGPAAEAHGYAVLALECPPAEGCSSRSWWRWNGDPAWIVRQAEGVGKLRAIDPSRMWIVGWSGGASYIGRRTQELERSFAALVMHGGGIPPAFAACSTEKAPVYFLTGDANPLHELAVRLRGHYEACGNDVTWTLLPHADHARERSGLAVYREAILTWLAGKSLARMP